MSATESKVISPEFDDCKVTPVCPSTVVEPALESIVTLPLDVAMDTAASPALTSSAAILELVSLCHYHSR